MFFLFLAVTVLQFPDSFPGIGNLQFRGFCRFLFSFSYQPAECTYFPGIEITAGKIQVSADPRTQRFIISGQLIFSFWTVPKNISLPGGYSRQDNKEMEIAGCRVDPEISLFFPGSTGMKRKQRNNSLCRGPTVIKTTADLENYQESPSKNYFYFPEKRGK